MTASGDEGVASHAALAVGPPWRRRQRDVRDPSFPGAVARGRRRRATKSLTRWNNPTSWSLSKNDKSPANQYLDEPLEAESGISITLSAAGGVTHVRPLRIGVQLPEVERVVRWPEYAAMARAAEEVGFDSVWVGDHLLYRGDGRPERGPWDAWALLAGLAGTT